MAYSETKIAEVLSVYAATGKNLKETAKRTGVSRPTIKKWASRDVPGGDSESVERKVAHKKGELKDRIQNWLDLLLEEAVKPDRIKKASYKELVGGAKIAYDIIVNLSGGAEDDVNTKPYTDALKEASKNIWSDDQ